MVAKQGNEMSETLLKFPSKEEAINWMYEAVDDPCVDNTRFAFLDDAAALYVYDEQERGGCCGSFDQEILVAGKLATVGCNYGH
jgi:hypothetical protein